VLDRAVDRRTALRMAAVPALSLVAACLTPVGPRLLSAQLAVGQRSPMITEWGPTSFRTMPAFVAGLMIAVVVICWSRGRRPSYLQLAVLLVGCGWIALVSRTVGCGAVIVAPLLAAALQDLVETRSPLRRPARGERVAVLGGALVCLVALALAVPHTATRPAQVPDGFSSRLAALPGGTPVAVEGASGAWLEWRFPRLDPTIDGMLDAYPVRYIADYGDFVGVRPGWTAYLRETGARVAITKRNTALTAAMQDQLGWRVADRDGGFVYLVAPGS
jgi:hypothetical protein